MEIKLWITETAIEKKQFKVILSFLLFFFYSRVWINWNHSMTDTDFHVSFVTKMDEQLSFFTFKIASNSIFLKVSQIANKRNSGGQLPAFLSGKKVLVNLSQFHQNGITGSYTFRKRDFTRSPI